MYLYGFMYMSNIYMIYICEASLFRRARMLSLRLKGTSRCPFYPYIWSFFIYNICTYTWRFVSHTHIYRRGKFKGNSVVEVGSVRQGICSTTSLHSIHFRWPKNAEESQAVLQLSKFVQLVFKENKNRFLQNMIIGINKLGLTKIKLIWFYWN